LQARSERLGKITHLREAAVVHFAQCMTAVHESRGTAVDDLPSAFAQVARRRVRSTLVCTFPMW
jgi:hypothetical protein